MDTACQEMLSSKWLKKVYQQLNAQALQAWQIWRKETVSRAVNGRFITVMSADGYLKKNVKPTLRIASRRGSGPISALSGSYVDIKRITLSIKQHEKEFVKSRQKSLALIELVTDSENKHLHESISRLVFDHLSASTKQPLPRGGGVM